MLKYTLKEKFINALISLIFIVIVAFMLRDFLIKNEINIDIYKNKNETKEVVVIEYDVKFEEFKPFDEVDISIPERESTLNNSVVIYGDLIPKSSIKDFNEIDIH